MANELSKDLNHCNLPDPIADRIKDLEIEMTELKEELIELKKGKE